MNLSAKKPIVKFPNSKRGAVAREPFVWDRHELSVLASSTCRTCSGSGIKRRTKLNSDPCSCVLGLIFRRCVKTLERCYSRVYRSRVFTHRDCFASMPSAEYIADFFLISRRTLTVADYQILRRLLSGAPHIDATARSRIELTLGRAFREVRPYGLYPTREYFTPCAPSSKPQERAQAVAA